MTKYESQDHYLDPETGVLKNKLGIKDEEELKKAEASLVAWRSYHLAHRNGYSIDWTNVGQEELLQASIESFQRGDNTKFAAFIYDNLQKLPVPASNAAVLSNKKKKNPEPS